MYLWITIDLNVIIKVVTSTFFIFIMLLVLVRISGLRSFAKMSSIDFASTIAIGSVLAGTIINDDPSIVKGALAIGCILLFQTFYSKAILKFNWLEKLASNKPLLLMKGEDILYENLHKTNLSKEDLMAKLREANVLKLSEVKAVILETTGDISVLHGGAEEELDDLMLEGVRHK